MMEDKIQLLDAVTLTQDLPQKGLRRGQVGTVVEALGEDAFEVEFAGLNGEAYALLPLHAEQIMVLRYAPAHAV